VPAAGGAGGNECDLDFVLGAVVPVTGTGTWSKFSGPGNVVFTPDNHTINSKVTVDKFGTYDFAWSVINSTCSSSDVIRVVFHDLPSIYAGRDTALCKGGTIQLRAQGTGTVLWSPGTKLNNRNIINPIASPDTTTTYTINLTDQYGCKNSDKIIVDVRDPILANAGPDQELGYVLNATMDATLAHDYEKGSWSLLSGTGVLSDRADPKTSVENLSIGINEFLWTVSNGYCPISYDTANIVVNDFVIPTMITPNMDGRNDYFELRGLSTLGKTELVVFNRRGVQLFKNSDYDNLWDGVDYNNNPLPEDTYFYVLKTANGKSLSGYLVIRR
jgi:gliding motility-associated-like protein